MTQPCHANARKRVTWASAVVSLVLIDLAVATSGLAQTMGQTPMVDGCAQCHLYLENPPPLPMAAATLAATVTRAAASPSLEHQRPASEPAASALAATQHADTSYAGVMP
jgi:hypothetical protein